jgi:glutathione S-transferase
MQIYYHHFASPTVRKVRAVAFELTLAPEEIRVDWNAGEHRSPWYLALNPNAKFPTLVDGDFTLWESNAICQYLATRVAEPELLPKDERLRAEVTRWQCWEVAHFAPAAAKLIALHSRPAVDATAHAAAVTDFQRWAGVLDGHLAGRQFLVGERLTVADFCVASMLMYAGSDALPLNGLTHVERWFATVEKTRGWQLSAPPVV